MKIWLGTMLLCVATIMGCSSGSNTEEKAGGKDGDDTTVATDGKKDGEGTTASKDDSSTKYP